jgi:amino acid adenylation domain-containing protein
MNTLEIITELKRNKVVPRLEGDQLRLVGETKNLSAEFIEQVKLSKSDLISFLRNSMDQVAFAPIPAVDSQEYYPASNAQKRLWVLSQFEGGAAAYNIVTSLYLKGTVIRENLAKAFRTSMRRHESLRTVFREIDGEPQQVILDEMPFDIEFEDISSMDDHKSYLKSEVEQSSNWKFDLEKGPLIRVKLLQLPDEGHAMIFGVHHIISDGWSIGILVPEVLRFYEAICNKEHYAPEPLRIHYKEYAQWLDKRLGGPRGQDAQEFWKNQELTGTDPLNLPTDFPRPDIKTFEGGLSKFYIDTDLYAGVLDFCKKNHVTPFNFFRSTLHILLYKFSGQSGNVIGTPVSGRNHFDLENQVGLYVNTLPLGTAIGAEDSFYSFLQKISEHSMRAFEYQDYPFDKIIEDLNIRRDTGRSPLFDVMMVLQSTSTGYGSININRKIGFEIDLLDKYLYSSGLADDDRRPSKFDLTFNFDFEPGEKFYLEIEYSAKLFKRDRIARFFDAYMHIIAQVLQKPEASVASIQVVSEEDKNKILNEFNLPIGQVEEYGILSLLGNSFRSFEAKPAVVAGKNVLTYGELEFYSGRVAAFLAPLLQAGEKPFAGLLMGRNEWTVVSILGILKAGGAYVPIDPKYPSSRIEYIIGDAQPGLIVVDDAGIGLVPEDYKGRIIHINELKSAEAAYTPVSKDMREETAYLIYTSGSTGRPKGVDICHRNTIAFLKWAGEEFAATPFEMLYASTSYCFDLSVFEFFFPLMQGRTIRMLESALQIPEFIGGDRNVMINTVPSVVRNLLDEGMDWTNVAALNMAGEPIPKKIKTDLDFSRMEVRNLYGPSEDTTYSTVYRFEQDDYASIPIGKPVGYTHLYIMDAHRNLLPEGVEGEIYLSGQSVAKGYLNKPELTAEKFLENPFIPGMPMYRTGDVGRWLPDGKVEFSGRIDDQVKVRGYRIELGEIQFLMEQHQQVEKAVAIVREIDGERQIVAYWVGDKSLTASVLKDYMSKSLPSYMVPAYWMQLDEIPLNSNGKVDKNRLPSPDAALVKETEVVPPASDLQFRLLELWKDVLRVDNIGITHNFFDAGGHSLKATRLRSLIIKEFEKDLTLNEIFAFPTIEKQAEIISAKAKTVAVVIEKTEEQPYYPISFMQERLWVLTRFEEASRAYNMPAAFRVKGTLDLQKLELAFQQVIRRHEILRTVFAEKSGKPVQVILAPQDISFSIEEILFDRTLTPEEEADFLREKWQSAFDLEKGPLLQCFLLRSPEGEVLSFNMHHIISDGWSVAVLYKNIIEAYKDLVAGGVGKLPVLELQYRDFAVWQRAQMSGERLKEHEDFWKGIFGDSVPVLELPYDFHRPEIKSYNGAVHYFQFPPQATAAVSKLSTQSGASLFMTLVAGVNVLLKKYANQDDIVVGTPVAGRDHQQLQDQIGFYVNTLAIRTKMNGNDSFRSLLAQQRDTILQAFEYQALPFELLVEDLNLKRNLSRSPLFDVMVVLQNLEGHQRGDMSYVTPELQLDRLTIPGGMAKYDLTFTFSEGAEGLSLELEYNTDLFRKETVERMATHLYRLLEQVTAEPDTAIKNISLLDESEQRLLASKADQTHVSYDTTATIVSLFEQAAQNHPTHTALVVDGKQISYSELDTRSGQLAARLMNDHGVLPEDLVVLHFDRSEWMIVGILAVLKAGAAYVPVDPAYPAARIDYIIGDSQSRLILCDAKPINALEERWEDKSFVDITTLAYEGETAQAPVKPENLAYVIYTSGTTGNPKGVLIEHRNVSRLLFNDNDLFDFGPHDRWTLFHSYCFDFSVWEMYGALLKGGTLVMVPKETAQDSLAFYSFLGKEKITVLNQTPTAFRSLVQNNRQRFSAEPLEVRYLIFGGEALMPSVLAEWHGAFPACRIINMYGITETTVHVTYKEITAEEIRQNTSNIGLPIPTLSCYVLDKDLQQVPAGVTGELCVGGAGVARGYLNKPELTSEKFINNPQGEGKLYRSGDYARILPSGDMEYIGRKDDQVKIRGHRIEVAEVETVITRQEGVKDAVVIPFKNPGGEYELAAYYIAEADLHHKELRRRLGGALPAYMVPSYLISLPAFPLNSNGKLDKAALPRPEEATDRQSEYIPPRNDVDRQIVAIWEEVLERSGIGIRDNFFDLGGHSLKATRVISRIHEMYGIKIDLKNLFIDPTVEHLSNYVETVQWMEKGSEVAVEGEDEIVF